MVQFGLFVSQQDYGRNYGPNCCRTWQHGRRKTPFLSRPQGNQLLLTFTNIAGEAKFNSDSIVEILRRTWGQRFRERSGMTVTLVTTSATNEHKKHRQFRLTQHFKSSDKQ